MHLAHSVPGIWYEADLEAPTPTGNLPRHRSLPSRHALHHRRPQRPRRLGLHQPRRRRPGRLHRAHPRHRPTAEYQTADGAWHPLLHQHEIIHVNGGKDVVLDVTATQHGSSPSPRSSPASLPTEKRALSLRWTIYDPANLTPPFLAINTATDWRQPRRRLLHLRRPRPKPRLRRRPGPHRLPRRRPHPHPRQPHHPQPHQPRPHRRRSTPAGMDPATIPYDQLPQVLDPPNGILATANARITPDDYPFPITLDWAAPYRNERIWKVLADKSASTRTTSPPPTCSPSRPTSTPTSTTSSPSASPTPSTTPADPTHDPSNRGQTPPPGRRPPPQLERQRRRRRRSPRHRRRRPRRPLAPAPQLATHSSTPSTRAQPERNQSPPQPLHLGRQDPTPKSSSSCTPPPAGSPRPTPPGTTSSPPPSKTASRSATPPPTSPNGRYGQFHPVDIEHPIYGQSAHPPRLIGIPTGTGLQPQSGDDTTVKQVGRTFGPSERFTADLANLDHSTLNLVLGQSGNPVSPGSWINGPPGTTAPPSPCPSPTPPSTPPPPTP